MVKTLRRILFPAIARVGKTDWPGSITLL